MSDKIGKYYWVKTKAGREIAFKRDSGLWEMHGIDCLEDCQEAIIKVYGEVANSAIMGENQRSKLFFKLLKFAMPTNYTDKAIKNIVSQFIDSKKNSG
jgi:hypothetical protein